MMSPLTLPNNGCRYVYHTESSDRIDVYYFQDRSPLLSYPLETGVLVENTKKLFLHRLNITKESSLEGVLKQMNISLKNTEARKAVEKILASLN